MQMMPRINWFHRVALDAFAPAPTVLATLIFSTLNVYFLRPVFIQVISTTAMIWPLVRWFLPT